MTTLPDLGDLPELGANCGKLPIVHGGDQRLRTERNVGRFEMIAFGRGYRSRSSWLKGPSKPECKNSGPIGQRWL